MASASAKNKTGETFYQCPACLQLYKDPKLLPCLHRYCRDCLHSKLQGCHQSEFECPICKERSKIPSEGVDGYKTDYHMNNMVQYIRLHKSFDIAEDKDCYGCMKPLKATAYCFRCGGFLCDQCYKFHCTRKLLTEHQQHTILLKDAKREQVTFEELASPMETPKCPKHVGQLLELCCETCGNLPLCKSCALHGDHNGHDICDVTTLANREKEKLEEQLAFLDLHEEEMYNLPHRVEEAKQKLQANLLSMRAKIRLLHEREVKRIKQKIKENNDELKRQLDEIDRQSEQRRIELEKQRDKELQMVTEKYDKLYGKDESKTDIPFSFTGGRDR